MSDERTTVRNAPGALRFGFLDASVFEDPTISVNAKAVYGLLACHADKAGKGTPGRKRMAASLGVSLDTVDRALRELRHVGVVTWVHRRGVTHQLLSSEYTLHHMGAPRAERDPAAGLAVGDALIEDAERQAAEASRTGAGSRTGAARGSPQGSGHPSRTGAATPSRTGAAVTTPSMNSTIEHPNPIGLGAAPTTLFDPEPVAAPAAPATPTTRGTRIPGDFKVTPEMRVWADGKGIPHAVQDAETEAFFDYWRAKPGQGGVKVDWPATWRNWMRTSQKGFGTNGRNGRRQSTLLAMPDWNNEGTTYYGG